MLLAFLEYPVKNNNKFSIIAEMKKKYRKRYSYGFSDHTTDILSSKVAISRAANVVERHFTLNKKI